MPFLNKYSFSKLRSMIHILRKGGRKLKIMAEENTNITPKKIRIILPVAGRFLLPYNVKQEVVIGKGGISKDQADILLETGYAEKV